MTKRLGPGTRLLLGLPEEDPTEVQHQHELYLKEKLRRLLQINLAFCEERVPDLWKELRAWNPSTREPPPPLGPIVYGVETIRERIVRKEPIGLHMRALDRAVADLGLRIAPDAARGMKRGANQSELTEASANAAERERTRRLGLLDSWFKTLKRTHRRLFVRSEQSRSMLKRLLVERLAKDIKRRKDLKRKARGLNAPVKKSSKRPRHQGLGRFVDKYLQDNYDKA